VIAVNLYRNFSDANLRCYLLVHEPGGDRVQLRLSPFCQQEMLDATRARISRSLGVRISKRALAFETIFSSWRRFRFHADGLDAITAYFAISYG
jgi:hypothetical protein